MSDAWAVLLAGIAGFSMAYALLQTREQSRGADEEIQKWAREIRKIALLITNHTPKEFGGCASGKAAKLAAGRLRQLHTGLAVRIFPDDRTGLNLLDSLEQLILDIESRNVGQDRHREVISMISVLLAENESSSAAAKGISLSGFYKWLYNLPEYLTEYDRERKTN